MTEDKIEQEIQAKGKTAPRVTPADIEANIAYEYYFTAADGVQGREGAPPSVSALGQLTFCVLVLNNGTKLVGINYGSIDPAQHNAQLGREDARAQAIEQVWPLMGYELRSKIAAAG